VKKLINKPEDVVTEELEGIAAAHPDLVRVQYNPNVIIRADAPIQGKVGLVSGGGSGHEPMHGGFVGLGMLDAACPGEVFTSPTPDQMLDATKAVDGGAGVLHIVKNYTGDVMNFEMAAELAGGESIQVEAVVIDDEMEIGIGIHGEPGRERMKVEPSAKIVERLASPIVEDLPFEQGDQVLAFVNGMGGTPLIELYIVYNDLRKFLDGRGITISRNLIGPYITSLEMAGCSITLLKLDDELIQLWDSPVKTAGLRWEA
jgi:dihydroxyacetone kinase-like protein